MGKKRVLRPWTLKEEEFVKENYGRLRVKELAAELGRTESSVRSHIKIMNFKRPLAHYEVYRGGELIAEGTAQECASKLKVTRKYIQWLSSESIHERIAGFDDPDNATIAFRKG
jgi:Mn-dependent DtxR family transcriptional regulator